MNLTPENGNKQCYLPVYGLSIIFIITFCFRENAPFWKKQFRYLVIRENTFLEIFIQEIIVDQRYTPDEEKYGN